MASRARSGKNTSQLMTTPTGPTGGGRSRTGSPVPTSASRAGQRVGRERLDEAPERHELAERARAAPSRPGRRSPRRRGRRRPPRCGSCVVVALDHAGDDDGVERVGERRQLGALLRTRRSAPRRRRRPRATATRSTGLSTSSDAARWRSNTSRSSVSIARRALRAAALHGGDVDEPTGRRRRRGRRRRASTAATSTTAAARPPASSAPTGDGRQRHGDRPRSRRRRAAIRRPGPRRRAGRRPGRRRGSTAARHRRASAPSPPRTAATLRAGRSHRPHRGGVAARAAPSRAARSSEARSHPGSVRSCIHQFVGASRATPASQPRRNRDHGATPGDRPVDEREADEGQGPEPHRRQRRADQQAPPTATAAAIHGSATAGRVATEAVPSSSTRRARRRGRGHYAPAAATRGRRRRRAASIRRITTMVPPGRLPRCLSALADAGRDADAAVGGAGEGDAGEVRGDVGLDGGDPVEVAGLVLGEAVAPAADAHLDAGRRRGRAGRRGRRAASARRASSSRSMARSSP